MIDVSELMDDPDFMSAYDVERITTVLQAVGDAAGEVATTLSAVQIQASVQPSKDPSALNMLPEGSRNGRIVRIFTKTQLFAEDGDNNTDTPDSQVVDRLVYQGRKWKVFAIRHWEPNGYCEAFAVNSDRMPPL